MLYKIAKVFDAFEIQIHSAKVSTKGGYGIDVFYVSLKSKKILSDKLIDHIKKEISSTMLINNLEDIE